MPRDYKSRAQPKKQSKPTPGWVWMLAGLLLGAFIVGLFWLKSSSSSNESQWLGAKPDKTPQKQESRHRPAPAKPVVKPPKPQYEFYTVLPEREVVVPEEELKQPKSPKAVSKPEDKNAIYYVQVGSFRKPEDADRLTAELALLGVEAQVVKAKINQHDVRYRVRTGPYKGKAALEKGRSKLSRHGHTGIVVRSAG